MQAPRPAAVAGAIGKRITVRQAAALMNVSERAVYMFRELEATGRADLCNDVMAGRISTLGALKIAKPEKYAKKKKPSNYEVLDAA